MMQKKRAKAAAATANRPAGGNYSRLALAIQRVYSGAAGAKSSARRGNLSLKRRTSAPQSIRRFFCACCSIYGGLYGASFGLAGFRFNQFSTPVQSVTNHVEMVVDGSNLKRSRNHEQHPHQPQGWTLNPTRTPKPPLSLAHGRTRNKSPHSDYRPQPSRGAAYFQPFAWLAGRGYQRPFCDLTAVKKLFEVTP